MSDGPELPTSTRPRAQHGRDTASPGEIPQGRQWPLQRIEPVTLHGVHVRLEPLSALHRADLAEAVRDGELWRLPQGGVPAPEQIGALVEQRLTEQAAGLGLPFAVIGSLQRRAIGMTGYLGIDPGRRHLEVGPTWYRGSAQRTAANTESKLLLLGHAFERLGCAMVRFRVPAANERARRALERFGARPHEAPIAAWSGDSLPPEQLLYRVADSEWPMVKARLQGLLLRPYADYTAAAWPKARGTPVG